MKLVHYYTNPASRGERVSVLACEDYGDLPAYAQDALKTELVTCMVCLEIAPELVRLEYTLYRVFEWR